MKKLLVIIFLFLLSASSVMAQNQVSDYKYQQEKYRQVASEFEVAKNEYLKQKTLKAQTDAAGKTKDLLLQRNQVFRTYFLALKYKLGNSNYFDTGIKNSLLTQIDSKISFLESSYIEIKNSDNGSLEDLLKLSTVVYDKQNEFYRLSHQSLLYISLSKVEQFQQNYVSTLEELEKTTTDNNKEFLANWLLQAKGVSRETEKLITQTKDVIAQIEDDDKVEAVEDIYDDAIDLLGGIKEKFKSGVNFQLEIARQLENYGQ